MNWDTGHIIAGPGRESKHRRLLSLPPSTRNRPLPTTFLMTNCGPMRAKMTQYAQRVSRGCPAMIASWTALLQPDLCSLRYLLFKSSASKQAFDLQPIDFVLFPSFPSLCLCASVVQHAFTCAKLQSTRPKCT